MAYDKAKAEAICERIANGEPLRQICRDPEMPGKSTFYEWLDADPELAGRFARARARGHDEIAEETLEIADDGRNDYVERISADGSAQKVFDPEHVQRSKLRIETRLKLLAKWDPKRYGEKVDLAVTGELKVESITRRIIDPKNAA